MKSISEINQRLKELNAKYKESGLTDGKISHKSAMANLKGSDTLKMSDEVKKKLSESKKGKPLSKQHRESLKKTKLKFKITKEEILKAQSLFKTAKEVASYFNIDCHTYKSICEYHKIYKKLSLSERNKQISSVPILCYDYKTGEFIKEYDSISDASRDLDLFNPNITSVCRGKYKQTGGYSFRYKDNNVS
jgi:hypothetical protein